MSIDLSQFYQVFFDEAQEHLGSLEQLLLEIDPVDPDAEGLNAIFRAAHSIKGSAGTFGFQDLAAVTHVMETLLDRVRKNETRLSEDMVDAFLEAGDVLKNLLAAHQGHAIADREAASAITARIEALLAQPDASAAGSAAAMSYEVAFVPAAEIAANASLTANLIDDLGRLGTVSLIAKGPPDGATPWRIEVDAAVDPRQVHGILEFVAVDGTIATTESGTAPAAAVEGRDFGLFEPVGFVAPDESWGLFQDPAPACEAPDGSFGFFTELPPRPAEPAPAAACEPASAPECSADETPATAVTPIAAASSRRTPRNAEGGAGPAAASVECGSIRVGVDKVDQMINLVGELVITQAMLCAAAEKIDPAAFERLLGGLAQLERNTRDLQEAVMSIRMMPISVVFSRFPRVVRDLSHKLGKSVELRMTGESTELDKGLIERITDPLTHLVRNSLDHGVELPDARVAAGKAPTGVITLKAYHQSGNIVIEVGDDGGGLRRDRILAKAKERGLQVHDGMSDQEVWQLIFEPGFSTAEQVTEVSGRGVGMDVVKRNITAMGGRVEIESMTGIGTRITVRLPLTLAILDGMSVGLDGETYIIPLNYVVESLQPAPGQIRTISGSDTVVQVRGEYLPVVGLGRTLGCGGGAAREPGGIMVVLEADGARAALFVDALLGQHQVVIKSLEANYRRVPGIAGATIMGDGRVALILDVAMMVGKAGRGLAAAA